MIKISILVTKWLPYITGFFGLLSLNRALLTMLIYRYDPGIPNSSHLPFLVSSLIVGIAMFVSRIIGALTQPAIGYCSDRFQSRWGKRRPFLAIAVLPLTLSFILLFIPPLGSNSIGNVVYLGILLCIFYLALAAYQIPYLALLPVLAPTVKQRINLSSLMAAFGLLGSAFGGIAAPLLTQQYGFPRMAIMIGSASFVTMLMPLIVHEDVTVSKPEYLPFWKSFKSGWQNDCFRIYLTGIASAWITISILSVSSTFLAVALLNKDISFGSVVNGLVLGGTMSGFALVIPLARRWGKSYTFQLSMVWLGGGLLAVAIWPFLVGSALLPWLALLAISNLGAASFFILPNAMLPDVIDRDTKQFGMRREAIYFGARGLLVEISVGIGSLLAGALLMLGKTPAQPWGVQIAFPVAGLFALGAAVAFAFYPIKK
ncbi:MFS transporter [Pleurocapsa sp. PCC 7319]|uniref:MFS transporter n=1 Tax=Pleurocapsa sp. PCC 7319 TaxID=118161 RepID=UPI00035D7176|nr:MFS transporter [Pleurocapsa sp. PCC 7319]